MQVSLSSKIIAGATALVGVTAVAVTPIAPALSLSAVSPARAAVALSAFENPLTDSLQSLGVGLSYVIDPTAVTTGTVWPGSYITAGDNVLIKALGVTTVGLLPQLLANPLPIITQLTSNLLGYANRVVVAGGAVLGAGATLAWLPVNLGGIILADALSGQTAAIPADIQAAIGASVTAVSTSFNVAVAQLTSIVNTVIARATAVVNVITAEIPKLIQIATGHVQIFAAAYQNVFAKTSAGFATGGLEGAWNAFAQGMFGIGGGTYGLSVPGVVTNLAGGAGIETNPTSGSPTTTFEPSIRATVTALVTQLTGALATAPVAPVAAVRPVAAKAKAAASAVAADGGAATAAPVKARRQAAAARAAAAK